MVDELTDIEKWKIIYSFLNDLWTSYENFDKTVEHGTNKIKYESVCSMFLTPFSDYKPEQYTFCVKLLRNLGHYSDKPESYNFTTMKCNNLNYWVYNSMKKHGISEEFIIDVFRDYSEMLEKSSTIRGCSYHSYEENYDDPTIAIMLNIFDSKISDIREALMHKGQSAYMSSHKFVCECFKVYKDRYNTQCFNIYHKGKKLENTCDKLETFKQAYEGFLLSEVSLAREIPSFVDIDSEYEAKCKRHEQIQVVVPHVVEDTGDGLSTTYIGERRNGSPSLTADAGDYADGKLSLDPNGQETTGSPISSTISTAVGTMAGASSVLALLYKFTPGRKWIHSWFGRRRARIGSNFYEEGASELLYNRIENEDFSSYNQRYDIGYSPL